jgi:2-phosphoglycerate kinase
MIRALLVSILSIVALCSCSLGMQQFHCGIRKHDIPQLVLISGKQEVELVKNVWIYSDVAHLPGSTGTGKSTLGLSIALKLGYSKFVSTDTVRQVLRSFESNAALHRSSYEGTEDAVRQWKECCSAVEPSINYLVKDALKRRTSLVIEGVHVAPNNDLLEEWKSAGGVAVGCVLTVRDSATHKKFIAKRGESSDSAICNPTARKQLKHFSRIRDIQVEMQRLAVQHNWLQIEQTPVPLSNPVNVILDFLQQPQRPL